MVETKESMKERLAKYQDAVKQKKDFENASRVKQVQKLDHEKKDISNYHSPVRKRRTSQVPSDCMVGKIDGGLLMDFEQSIRAEENANELSFKREADRSLKRDASERSPLAPTPEEEAEEKKAAVEFSKVLKTKLKDEDIDAEEEKDLTPFQRLRKRYLKAIKTLEPGPKKKLQPKNEFKEHIKVQKGKRESFVTVRNAWDNYEEKVLRRPIEQTIEDEKVEQQVKEAEQQVCNAWVEFAEDVAKEIQNNDDDDSDDEDDDLLKWIEEARRMRAENEKRRKRKEKEERRRRAKLEEERLMREDRELLEEAKRLMELAQKKKEQGQEDLEEILEFIDDDSDEEELADEQQDDKAWFAEARRQRDDAQKKTGKASPKDNSDDGRVVEQAKKLRQAFIRESKRTGSENQSANDDFARWVEAARIIIYGKGSESAAKSSEPDTDSPHRRSLANIKLGKNWFLKDDDKAEDDKGAKKSGPSEEARQRFQPPLVQKESQGKSATDTANDKTPEPAAKKLPDNNITSSVKDSGGASVENQQSGKKLNDESDSEESDDDEQRAAWLEEARKLKEEAIARKKAEAIAQGISVDSVVKADDGEDETQLAKEARRLRKVYLKERLARAAAADDEDDDEEEDDLALWIEAARQKRAAKLARKARKAKSGVSKSDSTATTDGGGKPEEGDSDSDDESPKKWIEKAKEHKAEANSFFKDLEREAWLEEARRASTGDASQQKSEDDAAVAILAWNLQQAHVREHAKSGDLAKDLERTRAQWIEDARRLQNFAPAKSGDDEEKAVSEEKESSKQWIERAKHVRNGELYHFTDPRKEMWLAEARRLREAAAAQKGASTTEAPELGSQDDEKVMQIAFKLENEHNSEATKGGAEQIEEPSHWIEKAREELTKTKEKKRRSKEKRKKDAEGYKQGGEKYVFSEPSKEAWLAEARQLREQAMAKRRAAGQSQAISQTEADIAGDERIVEEARQLRLAYVQERAKRSSQSDSDTDDEDDLAMWIEAARQKRAAVGVATDDVINYWDYFRQPKQLRTPDNSESQDDDEEMKSEGPGLQAHPSMYFEKNPYDVIYENIPKTPPKYKIRQSITNFWDHARERSKSPVDRKSAAISPKKSAMKSPTPQKASFDGFDQKGPVKVVKVEAKPPKSPQKATKVKKQAKPRDDSDSEGSVEIAPKKTTAVPSFWDSFSGKVQAKKVQSRRDSSDSDSDYSDSSDSSDSSREKAKFKSTPKASPPKPSVNPRQMVGKPPISPKKAPRKGA